MKRLIYIACVLAAIVTVCHANDKKLVFLISKDNWTAIPTAKKQQGKATMQACCDNDQTIPLGWSWDLRSKANTNKVFGFALYSGDAWALNMREKFTPAKIQQVKDVWESYGGNIEWTTNFVADVDAAGLEWIPETL